MRRAAPPPDVLLVSLASTSGWQTSDRELLGALERAGASAELLRTPAPAQVRTFMATDLLWARSARAATVAAIAQRRPRALIYCSITAALLWPRRGAIRFDTLACENRPGRHGIWQRVAERRRLAAAPLLLPMSERSLVGPALRRGDDAVVLPVPVESLGAERRRRDVAAITYAANPRKKGVARVLAAFLAVRREGEQLLVAGAGADELAAAGVRLPADASVRALGRLPRERYRELLGRSQAFVCAPVREDYGIAQLEALAAGCKLVTTEASGPYVALPIARALDRRLVGEDLGEALRAALDRPRPDYAARARELLAPYSRAAADRIVAEQVLPRLLG